MNVRQVILYLINRVSIRRPAIDTTKNAPYLSLKLINGTILIYEVRNGSKPACYCRINPYFKTLINRSSIWAKQSDWMYPTLLISTGRL